MAPDLQNDRIIEGVAVGRGSYWGEHCRFRLFHPGERIIIGRYSSISDYVTISAGGDHRPELPSIWPFDNFMNGLPNPTRTYKTRPRHTTIGSDVWIGDSAHIGGGVQLGDGCVVGGGAAVFRDVPPYAIVFGNPARLLRMRFPDEVVAALLKISWWDWPAEQLRSRLEWFYRPIEEFVAEFAMP